MLAATWRGNKLSKTSEDRNKVIQVSPLHLPSACQDDTVPAFLYMGLEDSVTHFWTQAGSLLLDEDQKF